MGKRAKEQRRAERRPPLSEVLTPEIARQMAATHDGRQALQRQLQMLALDEQRLHVAHDGLVAGIHRRAQDAAKLYADLEQRANTRRDDALAKDQRTAEIIKAALSELSA